MLNFFDLNMVQHFIDLSKVTNVVIRQPDVNFIVSFHFAGPHVVVANVNLQAVESIEAVLMRTGICT